MEHCMRCNSTRLVPGTVILQGFGDMSFVPKANRWFFWLPTVKLSADVCVQCGHVHLTADVANLERQAPMQSVVEGA